MTQKLTTSEQQLSEVTARLIARAAEEDLSISPNALGIPDQAIRLLARAHVELCDQVRALHSLAATDPDGTLKIARATVAIDQRRNVTAIGLPVTPPQLVLTTSKVEGLSPDDLLALYCRVMNEVSDVFVKHETYVVRVWDGMDGCWTDCTDEVGQEEALRVWAKSTDGGTRRVAFTEIDYYKIFPGGTRMLWDGSEGRELNR